MTLSKSPIPFCSLKFIDELPRVREVDDRLKETLREIRNRKLMAPATEGVWQGLRRSAREGLPGLSELDGIFEHEMLLDHALSLRTVSRMLDHPVANLLGRPTAFDPFNDKFAQLGMFDQFAIPRAAID